MDSSSKHRGNLSTPPSRPTLPHGPRVRLGTDSIEASQFTPQNLYALSPGHPTMPSSSLHPRFEPTYSNFTANASPSFSTAQHAPPHPVYHSSWNYALPVNPSMSYPVFGAFDPFVYVPANASGNNVAATHSSSSTHGLAREREPKDPDIFPSVTSYAHTSGHVIPAAAHPEHVLSWFQVCDDAIIVNGLRIFVPQTMYQPHAQGDRERYVSLATLHPPIVFVVQGSPEWGVPIQSLMSREPARLVEENEPAFASCGPSVGIRVQWPGYQPCHKQVATRDYTHKRGMIRKAKLAKVVARCVMQFMGVMSEQAMEIGSDPRWRIGPRDIRVDNVILVSLHHVSQGSWQPQLRLRGTIGTNAVAGPHSY